MKKLKKNQLLKLIDSRFHPYIMDEVFICKYIGVETLDYTKRVDILVKIRFIQLYVSGDAELFEYYKSLYLETINLFSDGSFVEPGDSDKKSKNDYISKFISLYEDIKIKGFNFSDGVIPVSNGIPLDGAHRIAIAYVLGLQLPTVEIKREPVDYGIHFFSERDRKNSIHIELVELMLDFYDDIRLAIIWPKANLTLSEVKSLFGNSYIFSKSLILNEHGLNNLCVSAYKDEPWSGDIDNNWAGSWVKSSLCYSKNKTFVVLFRSQFKGQDIEIKNSLRDQHDGSKHCMHSTDYAYDTRNISKCTFPRNSELYLNEIRLSELSKLKSQLVNEHLSYDIITGSSFMSVLGIRKSNDIDTLNLDGTGTHNEYIDNYSFTVQTLKIKSVYCFLDVNFLDLDEIRQFKVNRGEQKDFDDVKLIDSFFRGNSNSLNSMLLVRKRELLQYYQRKKRKITFVLVDVLKKIGLYSMLRKIYHFFL